MTWKLKEIGMTPSAEALEPGDHVELGFYPHRSAMFEHLWVRVFACPGNCYLVILIEDPETIEGLKTGDQVNFTAVHVARTRKATNE